MSSQLHECDIHTVCRGADDASGAGDTAAHDPPRQAGLAGAPLTCGAKGTRTPGLLDANHIFCVFLRRPVSPDEPFTCGDCRRPSAGVAWSRTPLALCLALLSHPSGLGGESCGADGARSREIVAGGADRSCCEARPRTAGQSTNFGHLALAIFSVGASWHVPPDTTETGVLTKPAHHQARVTLTS